MLERSVLNDQEVPSLLYQHYGIRAINDIVHVAGGSANCRRIICSNGSYLLKEFQTSFHPDDLQFEPHVNSFLRSHGVPTTTIIATHNGEYLWLLRNHVFHLQEYISGQIYDRNTAPLWLVEQSAQMLASIHSVLKGFRRLREGFPAAWFTFDEAKLQSIYSDLLKKTDDVEDKSLRNKIEADLAFKLSVLSDAGAIQIDPSKLTCCNTHGDYHVQQLICNLEHIEAVIDFSGACYQPACWEIARSYTYADPECAAGAITPANMIRYVSSYLRGYGLVKYDLEAMAPLYYLQLIRSTYGYRQYLIDKTVNREQLLHFGFWRTSLCRWLRENMTDLSKNLVSSLG